MYASDIKHPSPSLEDKLHQLYTLNRDKKIDLSFRPPYLDLLAAFGNPHLKLPPVIHVAGTNGKGSIIAMLKAILEAGGYSVHAYTSPHLTRFNERLYVAGELIDDATLEALIDEAIELNNGGDVTFFEITTAMAFAAFSRTPADVCLLEVGLGGRLDCTNIIDAPLVSIINGISYDHTEHLGETLPEIATEKAGIMKAQSPCVIGVQNQSTAQDDIQRVFESKALECGAPLFRYGADWLIEPFETDQATHMRFVFQGHELILPTPALQGAYQIENAGAALAALECIKAQLPLNEDAYAAGLSAAHWPARMQKIENGDLARLLPDGWMLYLDGGHNEGAGKALAHSIAQWQTTDANDLHLILGMMNHKTPKALLKPLLPYVSSITVIDIPNEPMAHSAQDLKRLIEKAFDDVQVSTASNPAEAITQITTAHSDASTILIAGSLYLAGHVLQGVNKTS